MLPKRELLDQMITLNHMYRPWEEEILHTWRMIKPLPLVGGIADEVCDFIMKNLLEGMINCTLYVCMHNHSPPILPLFLLSR